MRLFRIKHLRLRLRARLRRSGTPDVLGFRQISHRDRHFAAGLCLQLPGRLRSVLVLRGPYRSAGKVNRLPRVWFYARSVLYPRLITEYAAKLHMQKLTRHPWHVIVTHSDTTNLDTAFSLEPNIRLEAEPALASLCADIGAIAENLVTGIKAKAVAFLADISEPG